MSEDKRLYTEDLAARIRAGGPKKYRPANGTEGELFQEMWCYRCVKDEAAGRGDYENGCPILAKVFFLGVEDPDYPSEWDHGPDGQPRCTAFEEKT